MINHNSFPVRAELECTHMETFPSQFSPRIKRAVFNLPPFNHYCVAAQLFISLLAKIPKCADTEQCLCRLLYLRRLPFQGDCWCSRTVYPTRQKSRHDVNNLPSPGINVPFTYPFLVRAHSFETKTASSIK